MKLLLTSNGLTNQTIRSALEDLTGKPIGNTSIAFIPTAIHAEPDGGIYAWQTFQDQASVGWKDIRIIELTAFPSLDRTNWLKQLKSVDVILVGGGSTPYLSYWLQESGFAEELPELLKHTVYVGISAGSIVATSNMNINQTLRTKQGIYEDDQFGDRAPLHFGSDKTLGLVPFTLRPHLNADYFDSGTSMEDMKKQANKVDMPLYVLDDQSAVKVHDSSVDVVSEGAWKLLNP